ncbi:cation diffusion facilitator family transporter [Brucepastera parasyntrophica]|uniref:cation diffusion facilitator family transporter n=1 Tax=Brucepastera parasyntrophica TaxID=2880008 RepID=UPI00210C876F|nr:cation diffusion facilitator family transporter [Brucepastera parasyntrophica]ULQ60258.1 cation diffusion facilitator family transporter [Brucepastera parasyntrophica]
MKNISELSILKLVTIINFVFAAIGIVLSFFSRSSSVLFDALYSFVSSFFTIISARVVKLVTSAENRDYQFGYGSFEPFFIIIRTMVILVIYAFLLANSISIIRHGGNNVDISLVMVYTIVSLIICFVISMALRRIARKQKSPLLVAEYRSWINDTLLSLSVFVAFSLIVVLRRTSLNFITPYIDPAITILLILFMLPTLISQFFTNLRELLVAAPSPEIQDKLDHIIEPYIEKYDFAGFQVYSTKRGRNLYMVIHIYMKTDSTVRRLDKIRKAIIKDIKKFWHFSDIDIIFTIDPSWIPLSVPVIPAETPVIAVEIADENGDK